MTKSTMTDAKAKQIGRRIAALRKERGLSQRDVSGPGLSYAYVSRIENGARKPSLATLRHLAQKLNTTVEYLETGRHAVVMLMLDDYHPHLVEQGVIPSSLTMDEIKHLGDVTRKCCGKDVNPLRAAVKSLVIQRSEMELVVND